MRKGEPLRGSYCFFPEMLSEDDECGPGWGEDPAEILAGTCEGTPPKSWRNTRSWSKLFCTCEPLPPSSSWSGFSGWNGIFPLETSVSEISLKRSAACDNTVSDKTAFYTQSLGDLWFGRLFGRPAFGESRLLGGQDALLVCGDHLCPPQNMVTCLASPAPWPEGLRGSAGVRGGAADGLIYYFTELLLSDKGSLGPSRLASVEHIFNMNRKRNNKNMKWLIREPFHKGPAWWQVFWSLLPFANFQVEWNQTPWIQDSKLGLGLGLDGGRERRQKAELFGLFSHLPRVWGDFIAFWKALGSTSVFGGGCGPIVTQQVILTYSTISKMKLVPA